MFVTRSKVVKGFNFTIEFSLFEEFGIGFLTAFLRKHKEFIIHILAGFIDFSFTIEREDKYALY